MSSSYGYGVKAKYVAQSLMWLIGAMVCLRSRVSASCTVGPIVR